MSGNKILVTVDGIDEGEGVASLLLRGEEEETPLGIFPVACLPAGVEVGDILSMVFEREEELTREVRERVARLHEKLLGRK